MSEYDRVVVGSGLAGLTAGLFAARHGLSTLILESNIPGGHLISIEKIEDFSGFADGVAGYELCPTAQRQAADQGAEFQRGEVQSLEAKDRFWSVVTDEEQHLAKAVIVATGSTLKELGVPGEAQLMGRGVSHCASCDGPLYDGQAVGVVGGGDSALQEALTLSNFAASVTLFHREENLFRKRLPYISICCDRCGGAVAGRRDRLRCRVSPDIAGGVEAITFGFHPTVRWDMSGVAEFYNIFQECSIRLQTHINEQAGQFDFRYFVCNKVAHAHAAQSIVA